MQESAVDRLAAWSIFAVVLFSSAYFFGGSGFGQNATFSMTRALVEHGELHIDRYAGNTADVSRAGGHLYSNKVPGLSFLAAVPYAALYAIRGAPRTPLEGTFAQYVCSVAVCGVAASLIGVLLYRAARTRGVDPRTAYAIALAACFGTPLFAYATMLYPHVPSALFALVAFLSLDGTLRRNAALAGAAAGAASLMHYLSVLLVLVMLGFLLATSQRRVRETAQYVAGGLPFALLLGAYQLVVFGSPFRTTLDSTNPAFLVKGAWLGVFSLPKGGAVWGLTFSPFRGLFYLAPLLLAAAGGLAVMVRRQRAAAITIALTAILFLLVNAAFNGWYGGYAIGPRYVLPAVPLLVLGLCHVPRQARLLTISLAAVSIFFNVDVTVVDPQPPDTLRDPIGKYAIPSLLVGNSSDDADVPPWIPALYRGHTSTNRVAFDELTAYQRRPPGSRENEWASFNLGELLFGPGALASLFPWLLIAGAVVFTTRGRLRRPVPARPATPGTQTARSRSA